MPIAQGSAFENQQYGALGPHLWIIISDPSFDSNRVVIVNPTTWKDKAMQLNDKSCIIEGGDHPYINHKSFVFYKKAILTSEGHIQMAMDGGVLMVQDDCSPELLGKILRGAAESEFTPNEVKGVLQEQGLID